MTDHLFVLGWDGMDDTHQPVNGHHTAEPLHWRAGTTHRVRLINIGLANRPTFAVAQDTQLVTWRAEARDGADLPATQQVNGPSVVRIDVGETRDFLWRPAPGDYRLVVGNPKKPKYQQVIAVR